jgi:DNA-directed RNA polymerase subunit M/transcription elongation factor TFIIS
VEDVNLRTCPNCGALLPVSTPGTVESCRYCGAEGRSREAAVRAEEPKRPAGAPFVVDEEAIGSLCRRYVDNVRAYARKEKVRSQSTGVDEEPNEPLMRSIEDEIDIPENRRDEFRRDLLELIDALAANGKTFDSRTHKRVRQALELALASEEAVPT